MAYAGLIWLPFIVLAAALAWFRMDSLKTAHTDTQAYRAALGNPHTWIVSLLYIGTFGSFIGFGFAFGQVLQINFLASLSHGHAPTAAMTAAAALHAAQIAFIGPLLGSLVRPAGGWLSDRVGGGRITLYTFAAMILAAGWLAVAGEIADATPGVVSGRIMAAYVAGFIALFILSGVGNGSVYKMIPSVFDAKAQSADILGPAEKAVWSRRMAGALIGIAGAIGALGGVGINIVLRASYLSAAHSATMAFWVFLGFYVLCALITWFAYVRRPTTLPATTPSAVEEAAAAPA
jgi:MFS transporter, NNP family, nitrate/nitrite transporter